MKINDTKIDVMMPVLFIGHGNPMNAILDNSFSKEWKRLGKSLPRPKSILCISAHWETKGTYVTAMDKPKTIHDFYGFPKALYDVIYPATGDNLLAKYIKDNMVDFDISLDSSWGLDHGCWSVLKNMYPDADIPVIQLSLDYSKDIAYHYELSKHLEFLRNRGVLIICSGNMVHNLGMMSSNEDFGFDWAIEANNIFKDKIKKDKVIELIDFHHLGDSVKLAVPTLEHYLPIIYALALKRKNEKISFFNDYPVSGSLTMTSFLIE